MKVLFKILLLASAVVLAYLCVESIMKPIRFDEMKATRDKAVIERLIDIRKAQVEFRNLNGRYMASYDTLIDFIKNGEIPFVLKEGILSDEQLEAGLTEEKALAIVKKGNTSEIEKNGLVGFKRDTMFVSVLDTIYANRPNFNPDSLKYVPFAPKDTIEMNIGEISTASGFTIKLFEAKIPFNSYLKGLDRQQIINLNDRAKKLEKYQGLMVGSIEEANNNAGNWE